MRSSGRQPFRSLDIACRDIVRTCTRRRGGGAGGGEEEDANEEEEEKEGAEVRREGGHASTRKNKKNGEKIWSERISKEGGKGGEDKRKGRFTRPIRRLVPADTLDLQAVGSSGRSA